ncbi:MAG: hypothetical protein Fur0042_05880 [Cyanophyceae cyanobacterium]
MRGLDGAGVPGELGGGWLRLLRRWAAAHPYFYALAMGPVGGWFWEAGDGGAVGGDRGVDRRAG